MNLTIVAKITAVAGKEELVKNELVKLIDVTRKEKGCIQYDLHQDNQDPAVFLFFENWETRELWQDHMKNENLANFNLATDGAVVAFELNEMSLVK